jgi:biopolymer transport protein ExbD
MVRARRILMVLITLVATAAIQLPISAAAPETTNTPEQLVATYRSLADTILGAKKTEWNLVSSILATTYRHAEVTLAQVRGQIQAKQDAKANLEKLATLITQLGNEGDAAVGAVRKKLLDGGHHHNAAGEQQGIFDEGFVIVTRAAKKVFLDAAGQIGKSAQAPNLATLDAEWQKVQTQYTALMK